MARANADDLSLREREVLTSIVRHFIESGEPIGSRTVAKTNTEELSAATIRGIMADLEEAGYITHRHASAGRVPTDLGYRSYVDSMDAPSRLSADEQNALSTTFHAAGGIGSLLQRCCKLLAAASNHVGVVTASGPPALRIRHVELIKVAEDRLLVVMVSDGGLVQQHLLPVAVPESQAELDRHARFLNAEIGARSLTEMRARIACLIKEDRSCYDALARRALSLADFYLRVEGEAPVSIVVDGTERLLERPDPTDFDRMKALALALEDKRRLMEILAGCTAKAGVSTVIGAEADAPELAGCAVVSAGYHVDDARVGTVGIIGPTRMDYDRAMALVGYVAQLLGGVLAASRH